MAALGGAVKAPGKGKKVLVPHAEMGTAQWEPDRLPLTEVQLLMPATNILCEQPLFTTPQLPPSSLLESKLYARAVSGMANLLLETWRLYLSP